MANNPFVVQSRWVAETGAQQLQAKITCRICHREEWRHVQKPGFAAKVFAQRGWLLGPSRRRDVCPGCRNQKERRPDLTGPQRRAAYLAIEARDARQEAANEQASPEPINTVMAEKLAPLAEAMKSPSTYHRRGATTGFNSRSNLIRSARLHLKNPNARPDVHFRVYSEPGGTFGFTIIDQEIKTMPPETASQGAAQPPRAPTPAENRRVLDAMEAHYNTEKGLYKEAFSDAALAQKLDVPRAWVTKVRTDFYGPDKNEASLQRQARLDVAAGLAEQATKRLLEMAQEAEEIMTTLRKAADGAAS